MLKETSERRAEILEMANEMAANQNAGPNNDDDANGLIALALETRNPRLLNRVERETEGWLESPDCKETRQYLMDTVREAMETQTEAEGEEI